MSGNLILPALAFWPMAGGIITYIIGRKSVKGRDAFLYFTAAAEMVIAAAALFQRYSCGSDLTFIWNGFCAAPGTGEMGIVSGIALEFDGFRAIFVILSAFMWLMAVLFSKDYMKNRKNVNRFDLFILFTMGPAMGVFLSADLYTTFVFFEIMSLSSYVWVINDETPEAMHAGSSYLFYGVLGGLVMLMGIMLLNSRTGTLVLSNLATGIAQLDAGSMPGVYLACTLILFGFGAKAGFFPIHTWLPKTYMASPAPASALLSGILSKAGIFGAVAVTCNIMRGDARWGMMITVIGIITMATGAVLAIFSANLKRILACSSMSQIGFITVGIGIMGLLGAEGTVSGCGTLLHMLNHSLIKLVLFLVAGAVFLHTGSYDLNKVRGFGRKKPVLMVCFLAAAFAVAGIPMFSGYISKTLLHEGILEYYAVSGESAGMIKAVEWMFLACGGLTAAYMTKLFAAIFVEKNTDAEVQSEYDRIGRCMSLTGWISILIPTVVILALGFLPHLLMDRIAGAGLGFMNLSSGIDIAYFSAENLKGAVISIAIGAAVYFLIVRPLTMKKDKTGAKYYVKLWPEWMNLEKVIYRPLLLKILPAVGGFFSRLADSFVDAFVVLLRKTTHRQRATQHNQLHEDMLGKALGQTMDVCDSVSCRLKGKKENGSSHIPEMVEWEERTVRTNRIVVGSLAFALMLASLGLVAVLVYLLIIS
ncbi:MAG: complex I subunit 5 family protein [Lachnospiraceae bacterium]|jgi:formate hydrogenlyase subunit 3/multisubunit Na+/H+ antiporter MnhD subunit